MQHDALRGILDSESPLKCILGRQKITERFLLLLRQIVSFHSPGKALRMILMVDISYSVTMMRFGWLLVVEFTLHHLAC